jgi:hypothetical protein
MKRTFGWVMGAFTAVALAAPVGAQSDDYRYRGDYGRDGYARDGYSRDGYGRDDYGRGAFAAGRDRGFYEGAKDGARDARNRHGFNLYRDRTFRDGDQGYRSSYGPRSVYTRGFRQGYEQGYRRGYASRRDIYENDRYGYDRRDRRY